MKTNQLVKSMNAYILGLTEGEEFRDSVLTYQEIKNYAATLGYTFSDEDCHLLLEESFEGETVEHAVHDFLSAYGG